jgi:hypothetical protein
MVTSLDETIIVKLGMSAAHHRAEPSQLLVHESVIFPCKANGTVDGFFRIREEVNKERLAFLPSQAGPAILDY